MRSGPVAQHKAPSSGLADALMWVAIAMVEWCVAVVWALVRRPIVSVPVAVFVGVALWSGMAVAGGLLVCGLLVLVLWRLAYRDSFQRLVGRSLRCSWRRLWCMSGAGVR
jgi:hypothetical protein